jgi:hypothetical protein
MAKYVVKGICDEGPPPGDGFSTVTKLLPRNWRSVDAMGADRLVLLINVVGRADPFHSIVDLGTKFEPETVNVNPAAPTAFEFGNKVVSVGTGFGITLIVDAFDVNGPGLLTVMESVPKVVRSVAGIWKKSTDEPKLLLGVTVEPFSWMVVAEVKPVP